MKNWIEQSKIHWTNKSYIISLCVALGFLFFSFVVEFYAGVYATERSSSAVTDIILSNIRVYDVTKIFIYGPYILWSFVIMLGILKPQRIPFAMKSIALFLVIRSIFIILTHIGPFLPAETFPESILLEKFSFAGDLFFSAHTGLPFLMALIVWSEKYLRWIFLATSIFFGIVVLLGHYHYSIDVLSAFFITYTIFHMALFLFKKDRQIFLKGLTNSL